MHFVTDEAKREHPRLKDVCRRGYRRRFGIVLSCCPEGDCDATPHQARAFTRKSLACLHRNELLTIHRWEESIFHMFKRKFALRVG
jgi:hypothetical protein